MKTLLTALLFSVTLLGQSPPEPYVNRHTSHSKAYEFKPYSTTAPKGFEEKGNCFADAANHFNYLAPRLIAKMDTTGGDAQDLVDFMFDLYVSAYTDGCDKMVDRFVQAITARPLTMRDGLLLDMTTPTTDGSLGDIGISPSTVVPQ